MLNLLWRRKYLFTDILIKCSKVVMLIDFLGQLKNFIPVPTGTVFILKNFKYKLPTLVYRMYIVQ